MTYNFKGKNLTIPDEEIKKSMKLLELSKEEAIQLWLDDNDYTTNEVVEELSAKAKKEIKRYEKSDKKRKPSTRERKVDEDKKHLIAIVRVLLEGLNIQPIVRNEAEISFTYKENEYTYKLVKHRKKDTGAG